ncbi:MAG: hypothetical protein ACKO6K_06845, partial [Chitinophagaceae bacterium]
LGPQLLKLAHIHPLIKDKDFERLEAKFKGTAWTSPLLKRIQPILRFSREIRKAWLTGPALSTGKLSFPKNVFGLLPAPSAVKCISLQQSSPYSFVHQRNLFVNDESKN